MFAIFFVILGLIFTILTSMNTNSVKTKSIILLAVLLLTGAAYVSAGTDNVAEEVAWVVGDQPIWKSEIEEAYQTDRKSVV